MMKPFLNEQKIQANKVMFPYRVILVLRKYSFPAQDRYWTSFGRFGGSFLCWLIYQKEFFISVFKRSNLYEKRYEKVYVS